MSAPANSKLSDIFRDEKTRLEAKKNSVDEHINHQARVTAFNDSQRKRTTRYVHMMLYFVFGALAYFLVNILPNFFPFIPAMVITSLSILIIVITSYFVSRIYLELQSRSVSNYDEIDLPQKVDLSGNESGIALTETERSRRGLNLSALSGICMGETCCGTGSGFHPDIGRCMPICSGSQPDTSSNYTGANAICVLRTCRNPTEEADPVTNKCRKSTTFATLIPQNADTMSDFKTTGQQYIRPDLIPFSLDNIA